MDAQRKLKIIRNLALRCNIFDALNSEDLSDREIVLAAVRWKGAILERVSENLKEDKEIAVAVLRNDKNAFKFLSENLKNDKEIALFAAYQGTPIRFFSDKMITDVDVAINLVNYDVANFRYLPEETQNEYRVLSIAKGKRDYVSDKDLLFFEEKMKVLQILEDEKYLEKTAPISSNIKLKVNKF